MKTHVMENIFQCTKDNVNKYDFIPYARVLGMLFVILTHLFQQSNVSIWRAVAQVFIVGVVMFVFVSGYLYGTKAIDYYYPKGYWQWLKGRYFKILIPYYIFVLFVIIVDCTQYIKNIPSILLMFFTCVQDFCGDFFYSIRGVGHLWYITMMVMCYLLTPILFKFRDWFRSKKAEVCLVFFLILQIFVTLNLHYKVGRYLFYVLVYIFAFWIGINEKIMSFTSKRKSWLCITCLTLIAWLVRIIAFLYNDTSLWYQNVFIYYTHLILMFWIIYSLFCLQPIIKVEKINSIICKLSNISYYVFLIHFIYIDGPIKIIGCFQNLFIESILVLVISILSGYILSVICDVICKKSITY